MLLVKKNATEAQIWKALDEAKLAGTIKGLEYGLDTQITESLELSGGQLQRLSLARLFLKDTPIILLDEATSALDNKTQREVTDILKTKAKDKIIIAIAHRIEAVQDADKILFMEDGKLFVYECMCII